MKKKYQAPEVKVVSVRTDMLLGTGSPGSPVTTVNSNVFSKSTPQAGGPSVKARARSWDDDWFSWDED